MPVLRRRLRRGDPTSAVSAQYLNDIGEILDNLSVNGGYITRAGNNWTITVDQTDDDQLGDEEQFKVITDIRYDTANNKLQYQSKEIKAVIEVPSAGWTDWLTCTEQVNVVDIQYASNNIQVKTRNQHVLSADTISAWTNKITATSQQVVTDWQVSGLNLQVKTNTLWQLEKGTESGWTTKHTGAGC